LLTSFFENSQQLACGSDEAPELSSSDSVHRAMTNCHKTAMFVEYPITELLGGEASMKRKICWLSTVVAGVLLSYPVSAQIAGSTAGVGIDQRAAQEQERIERGAHTGSLTPSEIQRLEHQQHSIARQEQRMRARDNGELTAADRSHLQARENRGSNAIYRDVHNNQRDGAQHWQR
jgi:hypothetical protein